MAFYFWATPKIARTRKTKIARTRKTKTTGKRAASETKKTALRLRSYSTISLNFNILLISLSNSSGDNCWLASESAFFLSG